MDDITHSPPAGRAIRISPGLEPGDRDFLAGFAPRSGEMRRVWPGQPRHPSPWRPCPEGCCLLLVTGALPLGLAGAWLRWLAATFLSERCLSGTAVVPVRGGPVEVLVADGGEIFEGLADPPDLPPDDPLGGWSA